MFRDSVAVCNGDGSLVGPFLGKGDGCIHSGCLGEVVGSFAALSDQNAIRQNVPALHARLLDHFHGENAIVSGPIALSVFGPNQVRSALSFGSTSKVKPQSKV